MLQTNDTLMILIDIQERLIPAMFNKESLEKKLITFIKGLRVLEVPIMVTQQYTKGLGATIDSIKEALGDFEYFDKVSFSCLGDKPFMEKFSEFKGKNIIITGIEAHVCVQQTVLDLLEKNYNVYIATDCVGSRDENDCVYAEKRMEKAGAVLTTMESLLFEFLKGADNPKRKAISEIVK